MTRAPDLATAKSPRNFAQGQNEDGSERHAGERRKAKRALADHGQILSRIDGGCSCLGHGALK